MWKDFKAFALKGNVLDLAVAVIIGAAFGKIVSSLVNDIIMPLFGLLIGGIKLDGLTYQYGDAVLKYGVFLQSVVDFFIIAASLFFVIKMAGKLKRKEEITAPAPAAPSAEVVLLTEIRDTLRKNGSSTN
ncbi:large conductance mechanosensitive channel protein MscL [Paenibacillus mesotrionivorans]|jgi:large conductance mechanosensitive channel|uniref:Large conductance mechanosensitive channel protein MscL n=1 Tax=Paenibacillus mesotrionivorans TaxID=3160968 RepID=A0ACC7P1B7_9BACL